MKQIFLSIIIAIISLTGLFSQSFFFGLKGGSSIGYQKWETFNQKPVSTYHLAAFWESYSEDNPLNCLYAQLGYHNRGSSLRNAIGITIYNEYYRLPTRNFLFHNISLGLGAKKKQYIKDKLKSFYSFGLRGEYTIGTNLSKYADLNKRMSNLYYPDDFFVKKWTYGATVGGGVEYVFSELIEGLFEITINPDLSNQYDQIQLGSIVDPYHPGNTITVPRRRIKNTTVEITVGIRFMRKVEYID
jgi:hypothetical protein